jgi:hypothetical protein
MAGKDRPAEGDAVRHRRRTPRPLVAAAAGRTQFLETYGTGTLAPHFMVVYPEATAQDAQRRAGNEA